MRDGKRTPESARSVADAVRSYFGRYRINPELYKDQITDDLSPDPDDRAHAAACIHGDVDVLLTRNVKDFQATAISQAGVQVMAADTFLSSLLSRRHQAVIGTFTRTANTRKNPPVSVAGFADIVANAGTPRFAEQIKTYVSA